MREFEIEKIAPVQPGLWLAEIVVRTPDTVEGLDVGQVCMVRVRFSASNDLSAEALVHRAYDAARTVLSDAASAIADTSPEDFLAAAYEQLRPKSTEELMNKFAADQRS